MPAQAPPARPRNPSCPRGRAPAPAPAPSTGQHGPAAASATGPRPRHGGSETRRGTPLAARAAHTLLAEGTRDPALERGRLSVGCWGLLTPSHPGTAWHGGGKSPIVSPGSFPVTLPVPRLCWPQVGHSCPAPGHPPEPPVPCPRCHQPHRVRHGAEGKAGPAARGARGVTGAARGAQPGCSSRLSAGHTVPRGTAGSTATGHRRGPPGAPCTAGPGAGTGGRPATAGRERSRTPVLLPPAVRPGNGDPGSGAARCPLPSHLQPRSLRRSSPGRCAALPAAGSGSPRAGPPHLRGRAGGRAALRAPSAPHPPRRSPPRRRFRFHSGAGRSPPRAQQVGAGPGEGGGVGACRSLPAVPRQEVGAPPGPASPRCRCPSPVARGCQRRQRRPPGGARWGCGGRGLPSLPAAAGRPWRERRCGCWARRREGRRAGTGSGAVTLGLGWGDTGGAVAVGLTVWGDRRELCGAAGGVSVCPTCPQRSPSPQRSVPGSPPHPGGRRALPADAGDGAGAGVSQHHVHRGLHQPRLHRQRGPGGGTLRHPAPRHPAVEREYRGAGAVTPTGAVGERLGGLPAQCPRCPRRSAPTRTSRMTVCHCSGCWSPE